MPKSKSILNLIEANCGNCTHCQRLYYEQFMGFLLTTPGENRLALGRCKLKGLLVILVSSCREWANIELTSKEQTT